MWSGQLCERRPWRRAAGATHEGVNQVWTISDIPLLPRRPIFFGVIVVSGVVNKKSWCGYVELSGLCKEKSSLSSEK